MNSTEQTLGFSSITVSVTDGAGAAKKHSQITAFDDDKPLKNKNFSVVLDEQQGDHAQIDIPPQSHPSPLTALLAFQEQGSIEEGNGLPISGTVLPTEQQIPGVLQRQQVTGMSDRHALGNVEIAIAKQVQSPAVTDIVNVSGRENITSTQILASPSNHIVQQENLMGRTFVSNATQTMSEEGEVKQQLQKQPALITPCVHNTLAANTNMEAADTKGADRFNLPVSQGFQITQSTAVETTPSIQSNNPVLSVSGLNSLFPLKPQISTNQVLSGKTIDRTVTDLLSTEVEDSIVESPSVSTSRAVSQTYHQPPVTHSLQTALPIEVGKPGWSNAIMEKVMWMSSQRINSADIALDPPELGPLQVRITTSQDQTSVVFSSNHTVVREAVDQGLARLREMMESQGLNLADVDVSDQSTHQRENAEANDSETEHIDLADTAKTETQSVLSESNSTKTFVSSPLNLVDQYV